MIGTSDHDPASQELFGQVLLFNTPHRSES
jgi:hypothetical protein